jgi:hypothetical protein
VNETCLSKRHEPIALTGPLTVEHATPQSWVEHWRLPDGGKG